MDIKSIREKVNKLRSVKSLSKLANEIGAPLSLIEEINEELKIR